MSECLCLQGKPCACPCHHADAAAVPVPDAGDDTLRPIETQIAEIFMDRESCPKTRIDAIIGAVRDHVAAAVQAERERVKAEVAGEFQYLWTDYPKAMERAKNAEDVLRDIADHGLRADLTPTTPNLAGRDQTYSWCAGYLTRVDKALRERARAALDGTEATP